VLSKPEQDFWQKKLAEVSNVEQLPLLFSRFYLLQLDANLSSTVVDWFRPTFAEWPVIPRPCICDN